MFVVSSGSDFYQSYQSVFEIRNNYKCLSCGFNIAANLITVVYFENDNSNIVQEIWSELSPSFSDAFCCRQDLKCFQFPLEVQACCWFNNVWIFLEWSNYQIQWRDLGEGLGVPPPSTLGKKKVAERRKAKITQLPLSRSSRSGSAPDYWIT